MVFFISRVLWTVKYRDGPVTGPLLALYLDTVVVPALFPDFLPYLPRTPTDSKRRYNVRHSQDISVLQLFAFHIINIIN